MINFAANFSKQSKAKMNNNSYRPHPQPLPLKGGESRRRTAAYHPSLVGEGLGVGSVSFSYIEGYKAVYPRRETTMPRSCQRKDATGATQ